MIRMKVVKYISVSVLDNKIGNFVNNIRNFANKSSDFPFFVWYTMNLNDIPKGTTKKKWLKLV